MPQETARILWNNAEDDEYYRIGLTCDPEYATAVPGQFVTLKIPGRHDPLLRRPFSIHRLLRRDGKIYGLEILYRVVGGFTRGLAEKESGSTVDLLGPLGHGFTISKGMAKPVLVGGGIGVAPLVFLAEALHAARVDLSEGMAFIGGRTAGDILCQTDFDRLDMPVTITTEDGGLGRKGLITGPLEEWLAGNRSDMLYACGPHGLLRALSKIAVDRGIRSELSIETVMACGLGVCMGCAVKTNDLAEGYRHVCKHGPVFDAGVLVFD